PLTTVLLPALERFRRPLPRRSPCDHHSSSRRGRLATALSTASLAPNPAGHHPRNLGTARRPCRQARAPGSARPSTSTRSRGWAALHIPARTYVRARERRATQLRAVVVESFDAGVGARPALALAVGRARADTFAGGAGGLVRAERGCPYRVYGRRRGAARPRLC